LSAESDTLVYLYGIVPADSPEPPGDLRGIESAAVSLLRAGGVAALVSHVPARWYDDEPLNSRLDDLGWVGARGLEHERVLDWYVERGPVIPLSLFSIHRDLARVEARVAGESASFQRVLDRLSGRREWGIKLWREEAGAREGIDRLSPSLQVLGREIEAAPPGKRFLLERKREAMRTEEVRSISKRVAHELFGTLRRVAGEAVAVPLPAGTAGAERTLLLQAAFLVPEAGFAEFQGAVTEQASRLAGSGFELEFTGPWAPYHFTVPPDG
jgi:hypothetical protein